MQTTAIKNTVCSAYTGACTYGALTTTAPGVTTGTEVTGGTYTRIAAVWPAPSAGASTATAMAFNVPASTTVNGFELFNASTAGTYQDGATITSQTFSSAGTYTITPTVTFT